MRQLLFAPLLGAGLSLAYGTAAFAFSSAESTSNSPVAAATTPKKAPVAVPFLCWRELLAMARGVCGREPAGLRLFINVMIAFVPSAGLGFLIHDWIDEQFYSATPSPAQPPQDPVSYQSVIRATHQPL